MYDKLRAMPTKFYYKSGTLGDFLFVVTGVQFIVCKI